MIKRFVHNISNLLEQSTTYQRLVLSIVINCQYKRQQSIVILLRWVLKIQNIRTIQR